MKTKQYSCFFLLVYVLLLTACSEVQTITPNMPVLTFYELTPEYVGSLQFASYVKDVKDLMIGCEGAIHQWHGYAQQGKDNPGLYQDSQWIGYMGGTIEWINDTCGKFDNLTFPPELIALHAQLSTAAENYDKFTTDYVLGINHLDDHPELLTQADQLLTAGNDALNLAAIKLP